MASKRNKLNLQDKLRGSNEKSLLPFQKKALDQFLEDEKFNAKKIPKVKEKPKPKKKKGFEKGTIPKVEQGLRDAGVGSIEELKRIQDSLAKINRRKA